VHDILELDFSKLQLVGKGINANMKFEETK